MKLSETELKQYNDRLKRLMTEAISELQRIGIQPSKKISKISGNSRAKKRLGCCKKVRTGFREGYEVEISTSLIDQNDQIVKEVMIHELLHTCEGCLNHGIKWKELVKRVNQAYGYHITTTADKSAFVTVPPVQREYRYRIKCSRCGNENYRIKKSKVVQTPENYRCAKCGGKLEVEDI